MVREVSSGESTARALLEDAVRAGRTPGLQYLAVDASGPILELALGAADLAAARPMTPASALMAYSMSKTVTAAAVLRLSDEGRLALDDPLSKFLDPAPYGGAVTPRQLLAHTGGIPNPIPLRWVHPLATHPDFDERPALAAVLAAHPRLASPPGARYRYSNVGYWLLGGVVERASGRRFPDYVTRSVLEPLGIAPAELGYAPAPGVELAAGYLEKYSLLNLCKRLLIAPEYLGGYEGRWLRIAPHVPDGAAFGGLIGGARGFGKLLSDQLRPRSALFGEATRALFYAPQANARGAPVAMTLGWHLRELDGRRIYYKEGGGGGFHCEMRLDPERGRGSVLLANATGFAVRRALDALDRIAA
jgi:CubicO group peptidase (beta-lactamase class C family)